MPELPLGAVIAFDFDKWNVQEEIRLASRAGAKRIQVYRNYLQGITAGHIRGVLQNAGFIVDSLHAYIELEILVGQGPRFDLSSDVPEIRRAAIEIVRGETAFARDLGCRDVIVHPVGPGDTQDDAWRPEVLAQSAAEVARMARDADVRLLIENMPPPMFGADAAMLRRIVDDVGSPHLGLAYDVGHAFIARDTTGTIRAMGPWLWGVHLHDNDGKEDGHFLPGMGAAPFEDVCRTLAEVGFGGTFMLEIYRDTAEVDVDLTPARLAYIDSLRRIASGLA